jgi:nucleoside-diphosphate-sugar epimerase
LVMVGAAMCLLAGDPIVNADESWPLNEPRYSPYARTKTVADRAVLAASRPGFTTCVMRPGWVWGPGDPQTAALVEAARTGRLRLIDGGRYPIVASHLDNTVHGIALALERGRAGQGYYLFDDGAIPIGEFLGQILAAHGLAAPTKAIPRRAAWIAGSLMDAAWTITRRPGQPQLSRLMVALNGGPFLDSDEKARRELGYAPVISPAAVFAALTR